MATTKSEVQDDGALELPVRPPRRFRMKPLADQACDQPGVPTELRFSTLVGCGQA